MRSLTFASTTRLFITLGVFLSPPSLGALSPPSSVSLPNSGAYLEDLLFQSFPLAFHGQVPALVREIQKESAALDLHPLFIVSMMEVESSLNPEARGAAGEMGIFQLKPSTARWVSQRSGLQWYGKASLDHPLTSLTIASSFLKYLKEKHPVHFLAAYNMGPGNLKRLLDSGETPTIYLRRIHLKFKKHIALHQKSRRRLNSRSQK